MPDETTDTKRRVRKPSPAQLRAAAAELRDIATRTGPLQADAFRATADYLDHEAGKAVRS